MVNTKHDTAGYDRCGYQRDIIFDGNALYDGFVAAKKGSQWKPHVQQFEANLLLELAEMKKAHENGSFAFRPATHFVTAERGKTRAITGEQIHDRVVKHSLCDQVLSPAIRKYLIHDNGASLTGKGIDFSRRRLLTHLRKYYAKHKTNDGYVLLIDFTKYYDNIHHDKLIEQFKRYTQDNTAIRLLEMTFERAKVDVSYMSDSEYAGCMSNPFNSIEYQKIDHALLTGEKYMDKHLQIGDQVAQIAGIMYPIPIDNYIKIVKGIKYYGRYMDDSYIIHESKEYLKDLLLEVIEIADSIGIIINRAKTQIYKLSDYWRFLQVQYSLTETGRVVQKINPKRLTAMRRKMKKLALVMPSKEFTEWYNSWFENHYRIMSKQQRNNMKDLFNQLKEEINVHNNTDRRNTIRES